MSHHETPLVPGEEPGMWEPADYLGGPDLEQPDAELRERWEPVPHEPRMDEALIRAFDEKISSQLIASSQPVEVPEVTAATIRETLEALKTNVLVHPSRFAETSRAFADEPLLTVSQSPHLLPDTMLVIKGSVTIELPPRR